MEQIHQIDINQVIKNKNPKLFKLLPKFIISYIKKIIHQDELNNFFINAKDIYLHDYIKEIIKFYELNIEYSGLENVPENEGCIVVANHPLGGLDGIAIMNTIGFKRLNLKALVNDLLLNLSNMKELMIPINKIGKNNIQNSKRIDEFFASDECIILFPAGMVSRKQKGKIKDLEWKKSFVTKAVKYQKNVIPVYVEAKNSNFFYNLAALRKKIGIKANLEMFFLVDEVFKQKGETIKLTFGKPILHSTFTKEMTQIEWANKVKEHVYALKENPLKEF
jgi:putative hemolysin